MVLAREKLASGREPLVQIANALGYESENALQHGISSRHRLFTAPLCHCRSQWRQRHLIARFSMLRRGSSGMTRALRGRSVSKAAARLR